MKRIALATITCALVLGLAGCMMPSRFDVSMNLKKDGSYDFSYNGSLINLAMLSDMENGKMDAEAEQEVAAQIIEEMETFETASGISYAGNATFKIVYKASGIIHEEPLRVGMDGMPLFVMETSSDASQVVFQFLPGFEYERMAQQVPAAGLDAQGTIVFTTELPVESVAGNPDHAKNSQTYTWKVKGTTGELPAMTMKLQ